MRHDNLEQFILDHRESFDDAIPGLDAWGGVSNELDRVKRRKLQMWRVMGVAASVLVLLVSGALIGRAYTQHQYAANPIEQVAPEYAKLEKQYKQEIDQKYNKLVSYRQAQVVEPDLKALDEVMNELKQELQLAPQGKELEIVERLLKSYQAKVEILERVLDRVQPGDLEMNDENAAENDEITI
jgi:hypothetical protein